MAQFQASYKNPKKPKAVFSEVKESGFKPAKSGEFKEGLVYHVRDAHTGKISHDAVKLTGNIRVDSAKFEDYAVRGQVVVPVKKAPVKKAPAKKTTKTKTKKVTSPEEQTGVNDITVPSQTDNGGLGDVQ